MSRYDEEAESFTGPYADEEELRFLRYFYRKVEGALGPASGDIRQMIMEDFTDQTGVEVPPAFYPPVE